MEENKDLVTFIKVEELENSQEEPQVPQEIDTMPLETSTKDIINKLIQEKDIDKIKDLSASFNINQIKKNLVRSVKLNSLLDNIQDQAIERFEKRPDEISNKELLDYMQVVQSGIEKAQKSIESLDTSPMIQVQNNHVNVEIKQEPTLDKQSKENVLNVVNQILKMSQQTKQEEIIDATIEDKKEEDK